MALKSAATVFKTKCNIQRLNDLSEFSLTLYLNNDQVYMVNFEKNVLIHFRKSLNIGYSHYLVLFSICTTPGIALIETVLTGDPMYVEWMILAYMATSGSHFSRPLGMGSVWS